MNKDRLWVVAAVAAMAIIAAAGWFLGISPVLTSALASNSQVSSITAANQASLAQLASLKSQYDNIGPLQASLDKLRESIPTSTASSAFLSELNSLSAANNVTLSTVTIASATVYSAPGSSSTGTATTTAPASTATPTPTPTAAPATGTTTTTTAPTQSGLVQIPVTVIATGKLADVRNFMGAVQTGARLYLAGSVSLNTGTTATGTLTGEIFTLEGESTPEKSAPVTLPTPAPTSSATPSDIPTVTPTPTPTTTP